MVTEVGLTFERLGDTLRKAIDAAGACLVEALPQADDRLGPIAVALNPADAIHVITATRPRIVYFVEEAFDLDAQVEAALAELPTRADGDGMREELVIALDRLSRRTASHAGDVCVIIVSFVVDGVLHTGVTWPEWFETFQTGLNELIDKERQHIEETEAALDARDSEEIKRKAAVLAKHPAFNFGRTSFEKRCLLAEQLFPKLQYPVIARITDRAEKIDWLAKSGAMDGGLGDAE